MINRLTRILHRWLLLHPVHGIRPYLDAIVPDPGDEAKLLLEGTTSRLPLWLANDVDDESVSARYDPDQVPALVLVGQIANATTVYNKRTGEVWPDVDVSLAYLERETPLSSARVRSSYVQAAAVRSLRMLSDPQTARTVLPPELSTNPRAFYEPGKTWRELGDIELLEIRTVQESRLTGGVGDSTLVGVLLATCHVARRPV